MLIVAVMTKVFVPYFVSLVIHHLLEHLYRILLLIKGGKGGEGGERPRVGLHITTEEEEKTS